ncbi:hypothetical protein [Nocardioides mangrovi]|uniref:Uncharacterized protein n=1 Tax=Nocardioides mangrovi TaxID=2874580 RepID=A0ABS7UED6_9ACTN|nr:hypothetical protein [Nocardioides mangrovi]MBZ5739018.1 hypothetical protein [Nocardioides mangrovi]
MTDATRRTSAARYDDMMRLADLFDATGADMRHRAGLGERLLGDPALAESAELSTGSWNRFDEAVRGATTGKYGLLARSVELDADALVVRATVLTYRWIDELQDAAYRTLGSVAGRAIGYLAPEVALGGAVVSAGLIETDALDRDGVTAYLDELAENNPELLDHVSTGGGLLDGLRLRSLLTTPALATEDDAAARGGLAATGAETFAVDLGSALRDIAGGLVDRPEDDGTDEPPAAEGAGERPGGLEDLMAMLFAATRAVTVQRVAPGAYVVLLPGPHGRSQSQLRLVGGDHVPYTDRAIKAIEATVRADRVDGPARVLLAGSGPGGPTALDIAALSESTLFDVERVVTAGAPSALVPRVPRRTRMISLEDRTDPVALLGSLVNAAADNRLTVVFDGTGTEGAERYLAGARAADASTSPELRAELDSLRELGYLG